MDTRKLKSYAVWFSTQNTAIIENALNSLWANIADQYQIVSEEGHEPSAFEPWLKIGKNFYLLHTEAHWSPGDVCGLLRFRKLIPAHDECMAIAISKEWYLPNHGLQNNNHASSKLFDWKNQSERYQLISKR